jgi:isopenicillin N synthase-like dioxygenase
MKPTVPAQTIPVVQLSQFLSGNAAERAQFVQTMGRSLETLGFFALTDHGVDRSLIQQAYAAAEAVFTLPAAVKRQYEHQNLNGQRGFTHFGREHAKDSPYPDLKEFWHIGRASAQPANLWPAEVPAFAAHFSALFDQLEACAQALLRACALYLDLPESFLSDQVIDSPTLLRVIHYPPIPLDTPTAHLRAAPHEDINLITLLCEATAPGLELLQADGTWLPHCRHSWPDHCGHGGYAAKSHQRSPQKYDPSGGKSRQRSRSSVLTSVLRSPPSRSGFDALGPLR